MTPRERAARIAAPLVAAALVALATAKRGPALSPDSAVYLSVADHLAQGRGFVQFDGAPYVRWAPLYPWLLSLGPRIGVAAATVARVLQPLAYAGCVALCGAWLGRHVRGAGWRMVALWLVALSTIGIESAAFVWSESLDLLFTLGCLLALDAWIAGGRRRALVAALACALLACLARYASFVLVPVGAVAILLAPRTAAPRRRAVAALAYAVGASVPIALWMARNLGLGAGPLGATQAVGGFSWMQIAAQAGNAASHWVSPESSPPPVRMAALFAFAVTVVATLAAGLARAVRDRERWAAPALLVAFMGAHKIAVLVGAHFAAVEGIEERYLAPLFAPLVLTLAWGADRVTVLTAGARPRSRAWEVRALAALATLWLAFTALRTADREHGYLGEGAWGWNNARWERSQTLAFARDNHLRGLIYSNAPDALYAMAHVEARLTPRLHAYHAAGSAPDDMRRIAAEIDSANGARLVWFYRVDREFLAPLNVVEAGLPPGVPREGVSCRLEDGRVDWLPPRGASARSAGSGGGR